MKKFTLLICDFKAWNWQFWNSLLSDVQTDLSSGRDNLIEGQLGEDGEGFSGVEEDWEGGHFDFVNCSGLGSSL